MAFTIDVEFLRGLFDAGSSEERSGWEWPPSPARLFCALVAVAETNQHFDALRWLEAQRPPDIAASSEHRVALRREGYVPLNQIEGGSAYGRFAARKAGALQQWRHVSPKVPLVRYRWSATPTEDVWFALDQLVDAVPYLGRSTSAVSALIATGETRPNDDALATYVPGGLGDTRLVSLPRAGFVDELREAFDVGVSAHEVSRRHMAYGTDEPVGPPPHRSVYSSDFTVLPFADRKRIGAAHSMVASNAIRKALESQLDGGPVVLRGARSGEDRPTRQVLILALPDVGHQHASGLVAGVAVALPDSIEAGDRRAIFEALARVEDNGVTAGKLGLLRFDDRPSELRSLSSTYWTRPTRRWVSATPMTADRFVDLRKESEVVAEVRRACSHAELPQPSEIEVSLFPLADGAPSIRANLRVRRRGDVALPSLHARLVFDELVAGPVVLGNLRRYGLGLFAPDRRDA
jgi:CRISPR-associated protein Csb2